MTYPDRLEIVPLTTSPHATIRVPGSKSITNRALVLAALCSRTWCTMLEGCLCSEDTEVMARALGKLGFKIILWPPPGDCVTVESQSSEIVPAHRADLFVGNSGTTMRFLTALVSLGHGRYRLDGVERMRERPIGDLLLGLRQLGVDARSEFDNNCPPVVVETRGWQKSDVHIKGDVSSQFLSGLLMAAPFSTIDTTITIEGQQVSQAYVEMTVRMMEQWNLTIGRPAPGRFQIQGFQNPPPLARHRTFFSDTNQATMSHYSIEPDASAASYFWAASAIANGSVAVAGLDYDSLQGDVRFLDALVGMGCELHPSQSGHIYVSGAPLHGIDVDMNDISDTVMTLAAVACFADGPTTIRNVAHIRHKETDRRAALATELRRVGAEVEEFADGLKITPRPLHGAEIETYNDHRMAMSMALIGLKVPGIVIKNPGCVAKTYPQFWEDLEKLRQ
jgi:3-phosphoshikimate 1-carboxyvinyltransferase